MTPDKLICEFCGAVKNEVIFVIGASSKPDWCMVEGSGKMTCPDCYHEAMEEGQERIDRYIAKHNAACAPKPIAVECGLIAPISLGPIQWRLENKQMHATYNTETKEVFMADLTDVWNCPAEFTQTKRGLRKAWAALCNQFTDKTTIGAASQIFSGCGIRTHYWCMVD